MRSFFHIFQLRPLVLLLAVGFALIPVAGAEEAASVAVPQPVPVALPPLASLPEREILPITILPGRAETLAPPFVALPITVPASDQNDQSGAVTVLAGGLVRGQLRPEWRSPNTSLFFANIPLKIAADGTFIFAVPRDAVGGEKTAPKEAEKELNLLLTRRIIGKGGRLPQTVTKIIPLRVIARAWDVQHIDNLPARLTNEADDATLKKIAANTAAIRQIRQTESDLKGYTQNFIWPTQGRISGIFGSQRILAGVPHAFHSGIDVAAPVGTKLYAPVAGRVALIDRDMVLTGQTLVIDHGFGLFSIFAHLSKILVKPGQKIRQGQVIGRIGMTGRVTGPHVHWGLYWHDVAVDAGLLLPPLPPPLEAVTAAPNAPVPPPPAADGH